MRSKAFASMALASALVCFAAESPRAGGTPHDTFLTDDYAVVLHAVVDDRGWVDYAALKKAPQRLDEFMVSIDRLSRGVYAQWSRDAKVAFWINAYNALTLKLVADHYPFPEAAPAGSEYPARSIRQIPGAWDTIAFDVMGQKMTLDHIENEILRKEFSEPRIHAALVCAARSCPPLRREPYHAAALDEQLDDQVRRFLSSPAALSIDRDGGVVRLSAIFDWFARDFVEQYGEKGGRTDVPREAVIRFVGRYANDADRRYLEKNEYRVEYLEYDWTLNER